MRLRIIANQFVMGAAIRRAVDYAEQVLEHGWSEPLYFDGEGKRIDPYEEFGLIVIDVAA